MSEKLQDLAARKRLLLARSALARLQIRHQLYGVHTSMNWVNVGMQAATSRPVRSAMFGLALSRMGHNRVARLLAIASKAILFAKITGVALDVKRGLSNNNYQAADQLSSPSSRPG